MLWGLQRLRDPSAPSYELAVSLLQVLTQVGRPET
jgi:hypothetical protein